MSILDAVFLSVYTLCGLALGRYIGNRFGKLYGVVGFAVGFAGAMIIWRCIVRLIESAMRRSGKGD